MAEAVKVITVTPDELRSLVREAVREELGARAVTPSDKTLLTMQQAAVYCGLSKQALQRHVSSGRLVPDSPQRPGFATHRFKRSTLDAFLVKP